MVYGSKEQIFFNGNAYNRVDLFKYLGSMVRIDGDSTPEICTRLAIARDATRLTGLWKAKKYQLETEETAIVKSLMWSIIVAIVQTV